MSEIVDSDAPALIEAAKKLGLEGVVAKRKNLFYEPGRRSDAWVKCKINRGQEFVIGGYTRGNPFDAIVVGYYDNGKPHVRRELMAAMKPLSTEACPFANLPEKRRT